MSLTSGGFLGLRRTVGLINVWCFDMRGVLRRAVSLVSLIHGAADLIYGGFDKIR